MSAILSVTTEAFASLVLSTALLFILTVVTALLAILAVAIALSSISPVPIEAVPNVRRPVISRLPVTLAPPFTVSKVLVLS